jgi:hypothetical protein
MFSKQKDNKNKNNKKNLMGVFWNSHGHKNNQVYKIF